MNTTTTPPDEADQANYKKSLVTTATFKEAMTQQVNAQFEDTFLFLQSPEIYAMLLFTFYDVIRSDIHTRVGTSSRPALVDELYEQFCANESPFINKLRCCLEQLPAFGTGRSTMMTNPANFQGSVFENIRETLARVVLHLHGSYKHDLDMFFVSHQDKNSMCINRQVVSPYDMPYVTFVNMLSVETKRLLYANLNLAVELCERQAFLDIRKDLNNQDAATKRLFRSLKSTRLAEIETFIKRYFTCHQIYKVGSGSAATEAASINNPVALGGLPLLFFWEPLYEAMRPAVYKGAGSEHLLGSPVLTGEERNAIYIKNAFKVTATQLAAALLSNSCKYHDIWPPEFTIITTDTAQPIANPNDETRFWFMGPRLTHAYRLFCHAECGFENLYITLNYMILMYNNETGHQRISAYKILEHQMAVLKILTSEACLFLDVQSASMNFICTIAYLSTVSLTITLPGTTLRIESKTPPMSPPADMIVLSQSSSPDGQQQQAKKAPTVETTPPPPTQQQQQQQQPAPPPTTPLKSYDLLTDDSAPYLSKNETAIQRWRLLRFNLNTINLQRTLHGDPSLMIVCVPVVNREPAVRTHTKEAEEGASGVALLEHEVTTTITTTTTTSTITNDDSADTDEHSYSQDDTNSRVQTRKRKRHNNNLEEEIPDDEDGGEPKSKRPNRKQPTLNWQQITEQQEGLARPKRQKK